MLSYQEVRRKNRKDKRVFAKGREVGVDGNMGLEAGKGVYTETKGT